MSADIPDFTWWFRERPVDAKFYSGNFSIADGATITIVDLPGHDCILEVLEFGTNHQNIACYIGAYSEAGVASAALPIAFYDGSAGAAAMPSAANTYGAIHWTILHYDAVNNRYKMGLNRIVRFPHGVRIQFNNVTGAARNIAYVIVIQDKGVLP